MQLPPDIIGILAFGAFDAIGEAEEPAAHVDEAKFFLSQFAGADRFGLAHTAGSSLKILLLIDQLGIC